MEIGGTEKGVCKGIEGVIVSCSDISTKATPPKMAKRHIDLLDDSNSTDLRFTGFMHVQTELEPQDKGQ